jgi:peptidoglycan/LPS O-acetylase OafA/YrhL
MMPENARPSHQNNFDALRLVLATLVLWSHSYVLSGLESLEPLARFTTGQVDGGAIAVDGFFIISGYLITMSWMTSGSADLFLRRRIRRIYPGFIAATVVSAIIAAVLSPTPISYVKTVLFKAESMVRSVLFLGYGLLDSDKAFPSNPFANAVNGSLWTLQPELFCYLVVAGLGALGLLARRRLVLAGTGLLYAVYIAQVVRLGASPTDWTRLILYFACGSVAWLYRDRFPLGNRIATFLCCAAILLGVFVSPLLTIVLPGAGAYLLLSLAFTDRLRVHRAAARGDLSYGVYLYAFVIQQAVASVLPIRGHPMRLFVVALPVTFVAAWFSWTLVERRFVRSKPRFTINLSAELGRPLPRARDNH